MPPESVTYSVRATFCSSTSIPFAARSATKDCQPSPSQRAGLVCSRGIPMRASGETGQGGMMPGFAGLMSKGLCRTLLFMFFTEYMEAWRNAIHLSNAWTRIHTDENKLELL